MVLPRKPSPRGYETPPRTIGDPSASVSLPRAPVTDVGVSALASVTPKPSNSSAVGSSTAPTCPKIACWANCAGVKPLGPMTCRKRFRSAALTAPSLLRSPSAR